MLHERGDLSRDRRLGVEYEIRDASGCHTSVRHQRGWIALVPSFGFGAGCSVGAFRHCPGHSTPHSNRGEDASDYRSRDGESWVSHLQCVELAGVGIALEHFDRLTPKAVTMMYASRSRRKVVVGLSSTAGKHRHGNMVGAWTQPPTSLAGTRAGRPERSSIFGRGEVNIVRRATL